MRLKLNKLLGRGEKKEYPVPPAQKLPGHIAFIMDGNGRWAKQRGLPRSAGHSAGTEALREIIRTCSDIGISSMSIYAFSTENWARPAEEVQALMKLINRYFLSEIDELDEKGVRITIMGDVDAFEEEQRSVLLRAMERTKNNQGLKLNIALNYGGRAEIVRAAQELARACAKGEMSPDQIDMDALSGHMYTAGQGDVDLLIRTGGDERISNFMLWQSWYTEIIFEPCYWPDYNRQTLLKNLNQFAARDRRFGKVKEK